MSDLWGMRTSTMIYNSEKEIDRLVETGRAVEAGHFGEGTGNWPTPRANRAIDDRHTPPIEREAIVQAALGDVRRFLEQAADLVGRPLVCKQVYEIDPPLFEFSNGRRALRAAFGLTWFGK